MNVPRYLPNYCELCVCVCGQGGRGADRAMLTLGIPQGYAYLNPVSPGYNFPKHVIETTSNSARLLVLSFNCLLSYINAGSRSLVDYSQHRSLLRVTATTDSSTSVRCNDKPDPACIQRTCDGWKGRQPAVRGQPAVRARGGLLVGRVRKGFS